MVVSDFVILIPAYNEARTIHSVTQRALAQGHPVIVVDDGSTDGTAERIDSLPVTLLRNARNVGKAASLWRGMQYAIEQGAHAVITLDADGQHDPADIPRFIECARRHPGAIAVGSRLHAKGAIPPVRYRANRFANFWIAWAAGQPIIDSQCGFRLYPTGLLQGRETQPGRRDGFVFESEILIDAGRAGVAIVAVPIAAIYEAKARPSHFRPVTDVVRIAGMLVRKLFARGLDLPRLYRSLSTTALRCDPPPSLPPAPARSDARREAVHEP